jgi:hypothetical protein
LTDSLPVVIAAPVLATSWGRGGQVDVVELGAQLGLELVFKLSVTSRSYNWCNRMGLFGTWKPMWAGHRNKIQRKDHPQDQDTRLAQNAGDARCRTCILFDITPRVELGVLGFGAEYHFRLRLGLDRRQLRLGHDRCRLLDRLWNRQQGRGVGQQGARARKKSAVHTFQQPTTVRDVYKIGNTRLGRRLGNRCGLGFRLCLCLDSRHFLGLSGN